MNGLGKLLFQRKSIPQKNYFYQLFPLGLFCAIFMVILVALIIDEKHISNIYGAIFLLMVLLIIIMLGILSATRYLSKFDIYENGISTPYLIKKRMLLWNTIKDYSKSNENGTRLRYIDVRTNEGKILSFFQYKNDPINALELLENQLLEHGKQYTKDLSKRTNKN